MVHSPPWAKPKIAARAFGLAQGGPWQAGGRPADARPQSIHPPLSAQPAGLAAGGGGAPGLAGVDDGPRPRARHQPHASAAAVDGVAAGAPACGRSRTAGSSAAARPQRGTGTHTSPSITRTGPRACDHHRRARASCSHHAPGTRRRDAAGLAPATRCQHGRAPAAGHRPAAAPGRRRGAGPGRQRFMDRGTRRQRHPAPAQRPPLRAAAAAARQRRRPHGHGRALPAVAGVDRASVLKGPRQPGASTSTKATLAGRPDRLAQAWFVPRCTSTSPACMTVSPRSMMAVISPSSTMA